MPRTLQALFADATLADHAAGALLERGVRYEDVRVEGERLVVRLRDDQRPDEVEGLLRRHGASEVLAPTVLHAEEAVVHKHETEVGTVEAHPSVSHRPVEQQVALQDGRYEIRRLPVSRLADAVDLQAFQEGVLELVETREEPVIRKVARVVEEVVITKRLTERVETVHETLRREDVRVDFREHHARNWAGAAYEDWEPAYLLGAEAAARPGPPGRDWAVVEPDVQRAWTGSRPWAEVREAARYGYERRRQA